MSKNISKLSGRIGLKNNLFQKMSDSSLSSKNGGGITKIKEIADEYHVGISTVHGAESSGAKPRVVRGGPTGFAGIAPVCL